MAYIGKEPIVGNFQKCDALTASATADYTLQVSSTNVSPESANHMLVSLNGVIQQPGATGGFTVSGSTLSFTSALTSSDTIDFVILLGNVLDIGTPSDDTVTLAKMASGTDGNIISYDTSGNPVAVATGTDGQVLTSSGAGAVCAFEDAPGGGKVLQCIQYTDDTARSTSSSPWQVASNTMGGVITCAATSSKILAIVSTNISVTANDAALTIFRDSTNLGHTDYGLDYIHATGNYRSSTAVILDSPSSTSELTYQVKFGKHSTGAGGSVTVNAETAIGRLILMEIGV